MSPKTERIEVSPQFFFKDLELLEPASDNNLKRMRHISQTSINKRNMFKFTEHDVDETAYGDHIYKIFVKHFPGIAFQSFGDLKPIFVHGHTDKITGFKKQYFLQENFTWKKIIHPEDWAKFIGHIKKIRSENTHNLDFECRILSKNRNEKWVRTIISKVIDRGLEKDIIQGAVFDITEKKVIENRLKEMIFQGEESRKINQEKMSKKIKSSILPLVDQIEVNSKNKKQIDQLKNKLKTLT